MASYRSTTHIPAQNEKLRKMTRPVRGHRIINNNHGVDSYFSGTLKWLPSLLLLFFSNISSPGESDGSSFFLPDDFKLWLHCDIINKGVLNGWLSAVI